MEKIYKEIDSRLSPKKKKLQKYVKTKGYNYLSEFIHEKRKNNTSQIVANELSKNGNQKVSVHFIWSVDSRIRDHLTRLKRPDKEKRICVKCGVNAVPPENHRFCNTCFIENKRYSYDPTFGEPHILNF